MCRLSVDNRTGTEGMTEENIRNMNTTALAFLGDAVYEVYVRQHVLEQEKVHVDRLHRLAVKYVRADGQARVVKRLLAEDFLTEEEQALVKRARNHKSASKPKNADPVAYKLATAFEALLGFLHLREETDRMEELIRFAFTVTEEKP